MFLHVKRSEQNPHYLLRDKGRAMMMILLNLLLYAVLFFIAMLIENDWSNFIICLLLFALARVL
jgi:hypothetical protein